LDVINRKVQNGFVLMERIIMITVNSIVIKPFESKYQAAVEALVLPIQQIEFAVQITREEQPDLMYIADTFQFGKGNFWVALDGERVVGSIGLVDIGNNQVALKKMFVAREYRGKSTGVAQMLLDTAMHWCKSGGVKEIYLGTVERLHAARRFYEKNGFEEVAVPELPAAFPLVSVDTNFYKRIV
jgi:GNAT superfamily N-acetyltransferase